MKLDKIVALIRLANNNPSDIEANRAARKACLELAKDEHFMRTGVYGREPVRTAADKLRQHASNYSGSNINSDEMFRDLYNTIFGGRRGGKTQEQQKQAKTWNDVNRNDGEPEFKSSPPKEEYWKGGFKPSAAQEEFFRNARRVNVDDEKWSWDKETKGSWNNPNPNIKYDAQGRRVREHAIRKCSKCGFEVDTFRTTEQPFVCNPCHWKEYP